MFTGQPLLTRNFIRSPCGISFFPEDPSLPFRDVRQPSQLQCSACLLSSRGKFDLETTPRRFHPRHGLDASSKCLFFPELRNARDSGVGVARNHTPTHVVDEPATSCWRRERIVPPVKSQLSKTSPAVCVMYDRGRSTRDKLDVPLFHAKNVVSVKERNISSATDETEFENLLIRILVMEYARNPSL